jgi:hypothetical protein
MSTECEHFGYKNWGSSNGLQNKILISLKIVLTIFIKFQHFIKTTSINKTVTTKQGKVKLNELKAGDVDIHMFLTSALFEDEWSVLCPSSFTLRERVPSTHWIGGWMSHRATQNKERSENS